MQEQAPPGWYPDNQGNERFWDGIAWTEQVRSQLSVVGNDPAEPKKKAGAFSKFGSAIKKAAADRQATKDEISRQFAEAQQLAGGLVTSGVFGLSTIEIYENVYVRVAEGRAEATQAAKMTDKVPFEKLRSIKFTAAGNDAQSSGFDSSALTKGASTLLKGGSGLLRASAPGLAVAGLSQVAKAKLGKTYLTIATDRAIHTLTNETHNGFMKVSNKGHNDVGLVLEEAGNAALGLAGAGEALSSNLVETQPQPEAEPPRRVQMTEPSVGDRLRELADLHRDRILSDEEFTSAKAKLLGL